MDALATFSDFDLAAPAAEAAWVITRAPVKMSEVVSRILMACSPSLKDAVFDHLDYRGTGGAAESTGVVARPRAFIPSLLPDRVVRDVRANLDAKVRAT